MIELKLLKTAIKPTSDSTLNIVMRDTHYDPFVVCWNFDGIEWDWGTYCETYEKAVEVFNEKCQKRGMIEVPV